MIKKILMLLMLLLPLTIYTKDFAISNNHEEIKQEDKDKIILIFGAEWCKYCLLLKNNLETLNLDNYKIYFIDVDENKELKIKYDVKSLPTSIILSNEKIISKKIGFNKNDYNKWLEDNR
jgi:thioredoxin 1